ncbi:hypothetical protein B0A48_00168 [Cryoendolithus antarcticus]|uniref:Uncharacterized protein n=1 Tax=Cryoendolithus antarcticus TaxID=1507870 RepID=A0A1V8TTU9_9PEZI|nr:hypothetical protein B0A48_00168 [Cryoendolithus antarcticus]
MRQTNSTRTWRPLLWDGDHQSCVSRPIARCHMKSQSTSFHTAVRLRIVSELTRPSQGPTACGLVSPKSQGVHVPVHQALLRFHKDQIRVGGSRRQRGTDNVLLAIEHWHYSTSVDRNLLQIVAIELGFDPTSYQKADLADGDRFVLTWQVSALMDTIKWFTSADSQHLTTFKRTGRSYDSQDFEPDKLADQWAV